MDYQLQVITLSVSDVDKAAAFYTWQARREPPASADPASLPDAGHFISPAWPTDPEIASVGLTEAEAREQHGDDVATGMFPWIANARAVMQNEKAGWVKSIHTTRDGKLLGLVMIGPHVTDMVEAGVIAIDVPPVETSPLTRRSRQAVMSATSATMRHRRREDARP